MKVYNPKIDETLYSHNVIETFDVADTVITFTDVHEELIDGAILQRTWSYNVANILVSISEWVFSNPPTPTAVTPASFQITEATAFEIAGTNFGTDTDNIQVIFHITTPSGNWSGRSFNIQAAITSCADNLIQGILTLNDIPDKPVMAGATTTVSVFRVDMMVESSELDAAVTARPGSVF